MFILALATLPAFATGLELFLPDQPGKKEAAEVVLPPDDQGCCEAISCPEFAGQTFTHRSRCTRVSSSASISRRARTPMRLICCPPLPDEPDALGATTLPCTAAAPPPPLCWRVGQRARLGRCRELRGTTRLGSNGVHSIRVASAPLIG